MTQLKKSLEIWLDELADRHPQHNIRLGLERMKEAASRMQLTQPKARVVTIAGTNGKGSCLMLLERLLVTQGLNVGSFQSPHISNFCERIRIKGVNVQPELIASAFDRIDGLCDDLELTFFEWNTLAALDIFSQNELDVLLLEVGLGGRLDAVNIIDNELSVITAIDYDHTEWLGDSLESIATEKVGVIREDSQLVSHSELPPIASKCLELSVRACYWRKDFDIAEQRGRWIFHGKRSNDAAVECISPLPSGCLPDNLALALQAYLSLGFDLSAALTHEAFANFVLPARQQYIRHDDLHILLDVAHNAAGLRALAQRVAKDFANIPAVALVGMLSDKQAVPDLAGLFPSVKRWILLTLTGARGQTALQLAEKLQLENYTLLDAVDGLGLRQLMGSESLLVATGSFHTCDKVRGLLARS